MLSDIPVVDNGLAINKIRVGVVYIKRAGDLVFVPIPTISEDLLAVGIAMVGVGYMVWGVVDLFIPAEEE